MVFVGIAVRGRGVVTDVYTYTTMPNWHYVVVDGRIHCLGGGNAIAIEMPRKPRDKVYITQTAEAVYVNRFLWTGKDIRIKDSVANTGGILSDATNVSKYIVMLILDGKIINFAKDSELEVEL